MLFIVNEKLKFSGCYFEYMLFIEIDKLKIPGGDI